RARELKPDIKVLLTSGYAIETLASRGRLSPEFAVLNKPYRKTDLAGRLREDAARERRAGLAVGREAGLDLASEDGADRDRVGVGRQRREHFGRAHAEPRHQRQRRERAQA